MQVKLQPRSTFTFLLVLAFLYLAYLIFFASGDGFPEIDIDLKDIASYAVLAAHLGGKAVKQIHEENLLNIAEKGLTAEGKAELLTKADLISNFFILEQMKRIPKLKLITEEHGSDTSDSEAKPYRIDSYAAWLKIRDALDKIPSRRLDLEQLQVYIDPLDATQEFTENLTSYVTVMVCVAVADEPIFGVVYRPFSDETIMGLKDFGVINGKGEKQVPPPKPETAKKIIVSRSHAGTVEELARKVFGKDYEVEPAGGAGYKSLRVLNGSAEVYVHKTAIKKWDTCAGDAILRAVGGAMIDFDGTPLKYGHESDILHKRGIIAAAKMPYSYYKKFQPYVDKI